MHSIEVDFEVFKALTMRRAAETVTYNDVIRDLLNLSKAQPTNSVGPVRYLVCRGGRIPIGTKLRASYRGVQYEAVVTDRGIDFQGKCYRTPSKAAMAITKSNINGWNFWDAQPPGATGWRKLTALR